MYYVGNSQGEQGQTWGAQEERWVVAVNGDMELGTGLDLGTPVTSC